MHPSVDKMNDAESVMLSASGTKAQSDEATEKVASSFPLDEGMVGLGVGIVEMERIRALLGDEPGFIEGVFSEDERLSCENAALPDTQFAMRLAAKEAALKALRIVEPSQELLRLVEVERDAKGHPTLLLQGELCALAQEQGVQELPLSLSYTHLGAVGIVLALTADSARPARKRTDPSEELARRFKELRAILDEDFLLGEDAAKELQELL